MSKHDLDSALPNPPIPFMHVHESSSEGMEMTESPSAQQKAQKGYQVLHRGRPELPPGYVLPRNPVAKLHKERR